MKKRLLLATLGLLVFLVPSAAPAAERTVTVYAARLGDVEKSLYAEFQKKTGIIVNVVEGKAGELLKRMAAEGEATRADLFAAVDGGVLHRAKADGLLQPIPARVRADIPTALRDPEAHWVALSTRARVIVYAKDRVSEKDLSTYEALADPRWRGKVVQRPGSAQYNLSLLASLITLVGEEKTAAFVNGMARNFARPPKGGDRTQAKDIAEGTADVAFMNTYYIGRMLHSAKPEEAAAAAKLGVFFPNQATTGTHVNVNAIGLARHAKNPASAIALIEFLTSVPAQEKLSAATFEFPANEKAKKPALLESWGPFRMQSIDFAVLAENKKAAERLAVENGWGCE